MEAVELVMKHAGTELVLGPFGLGLVVTDTSIFEPHSGPEHSIAEWTYADGIRGESEGWALQQHPYSGEGHLYEMALVRGAQ